MAFGALFKIFHWPGASLMLSVSFFFTTLVFFPSLLFLMYKEVNQKKHALLYLGIFIAGAAFMIGVLFKIMHWPGAALLIFGGICLIAYVMLPTLLIQRLKKSSINRSVLLMGFIPLIIFISGLLFKMQHWPGAAFLLTIGSLFLIMVFVPLYYFVEIKKSETFRLDFIFAIIALTYFIVLSFLLQMNLVKQVPLDMNFQNNSFKQNLEYFSSENIKLNKNNSDEKLNTMLESSNNLCQEIEKLKLIIVQQNNKVDFASAQKILLHKNPLQNPYESINKLLPEFNQNSPFTSLKLHINTFLELYAIQTDSLVNSYPIYQIFNTEETNWEQTNFGHISAIAALTKLSFWQYQVQLAQNVLYNKTRLTPKN